MARGTSLDEAGPEMNIDLASEYQLLVYEQLVVNVGEQKLVLELLPIWRTRHAMRSRMASGSHAHTEMTRFRRCTHPTQMPRVLSIGECWEE